MSYEEGTRQPHHRKQVLDDSDSDDDDGVSDAGGSKTKEMLMMREGDHEGATPKISVGSAGVGGESSGQDGDDDDDGEFDDDDSSIRKGGMGGGGRGPGSTSQKTSSTMAALFGSDDEDEDEDEDGKPAGSGDEGGRAFDASKRGGGAGLGRGGVGGGGSDDEMEEVLEDEEIALPPLPQLAEGVRHYTARIPNILGVKSERFDPKTYSEEAAEVEFKEYSTRNIMRWRYKIGADGEPAHDALDGGAPDVESNTRLVKWSDGSMQLLIGDEAFDVNVNSNNGRSFLFAQQVTQRAGTSSSSTCLECQAAIPDRLSFKPVSIKSNVHKELTLRVKNKKISETGSQGMQRHTVAADPEKLKMERIKQMEDKSRLEKRKSKSSGGYTGGRRAKMDAGFLEEEEERDYDNVGLRAIKESAKRGRYDFSDDSEEESDKDDEDMLSSKPGAGGGAAAASRRDRDRRMATRQQRQSQSSQRTSQDSESETAGFQGEDEDSGKDDDDYGGRCGSGASSSAGGGGGGDGGGGGRAAAAAAGAGGGDESDDDVGMGAGARPGRGSRKRKMVDSDSD